MEEDEQDTNESGVQNNEEPGFVHLLNSQMETDQNSGQGKAIFFSK